MECIILAGGFGTRLSHIVSNVPKPMAPIGDRPFLSYIFDDLIHKGVTRFIMAVGYKSECITGFYGNRYKQADLLYSYEDKPLGTGGAIKQALRLCRDKDVFVINGDTFFDVNLSQMLFKAQDSICDMMIAVKRLKNFDRYGTLSIQDGFIKDFKEKKPMMEGFINGGIYLLKSKIFEFLPDGSFSFEKDFMEKQIDILNIGALESEGYFIDIGVPEDYYRACEEFIK